MTTSKPSIVGLPAGIYIGHAFAALIFITAGPEAFVRYAFSIGIRAEIQYGALRKINESR